jgi:hypothetical protein
MAQDQEEPFDPFRWARTLDDLDLSWQWGEFAFQPRVAVTIEAFFFGDEAPGVTVEDPAVRDGEYERDEEADSPEFNRRLQVFLDGSFRSWLEWSIEGRLDGTTSVGGHLGARIEQWWARLKVPDEPALNFQLGKFAAPVGNFIPRHAPSKNPLTTWPLAYDHLTALTSLADDVTAIEINRDAPDIKDWYVPIWQGIYGVGVMGHGTLGPASWNAALMNSAPATLPEEWDDEIGDPDFLNLYLRLLVAVDAATRVGASWTRGPYEHGDAKGAAAGPGPGPGSGGGFGSAEHSYQTLFGVDASWAGGKWELFSEICWTRLEAPALDDLELWTWYVEGKVAITPAIFGAARLAQMFFGETGDATTSSFQWDRDVSRVEFGGGYQFTPNLFAKVTAQLNYHRGGREPNDPMLMMQVGLGF